MADERKNAKFTIEGLQSQLEGLAGRINDMEYVKQEQEGTIRVQLEEQSTASSQIKVRGGYMQLGFSCVLRMKDSQPACLEEVWCQGEGENCRLLDFD